LPSTKAATAHQNKGVIEMKKLTILFGFVICLMSCTIWVTADNPWAAECPPQDIVIYYMNPLYGPQFLKIKKGHFDDPDNYWTMEEWEKQNTPKMEEETIDPKDGNKEL
jgi:hypothetical protein